MISIRRKIDESEHFALSFQALAKVFLGLANALPNAALPANPELSEQCRATLRRATEKIEDTPSRSEIDAAGTATLSQFDEICRANRSAFEERDAAIKDVVTSVAGAINGFKGQGRQNESSLTRVADGFEALARIGDANELRHKLHQNVAQLRQAVEEMRRESEQTVERFESQIQSFEQRLEAARRGSGADRLTGVSSRRQAEEQLRKLPKAKKARCLMLFDIEGFGGINARYGSPFGDKLLQALAHALKVHFPEQDMLFRWAADEFLVIADGPFAMRVSQCHKIADSFAGSRYSTFEAGTRTSVSALLATGAAEYQSGESVEELYQRARQSLEESRVSLL